MSQFWLHVNHPNDKARIHAENGCAWVRKAVRRIQYGPIHGDRNGYWDGPYSSIQEAEAAQERTGKTVRDQCGLCWR